MDYIDKDENTCLLNEVIEVKCCNQGQNKKKKS